MAKKSNKPMLDKIKEFWNNYKIWIALILLVFALIVVNFLLFRIYENANPDASFWILLWNFLSSDGFKVVTISFLLPIFLLLTEIIFKVKERDDAKIEEEQKKRQE